VPCARKRLPGWKEARAGGSEHGGPFSEGSTIKGTGSRHVSEKHLQGHNDQGGILGESNRARDELTPAGGGNEPSGRIARGGRCGMVPTSRRQVRQKKSGLLAQPNSQFEEKDDRRISRDEAVS